MAEGQRNISRRQLLKLAGAGFASSLLAACGVRSQHPETPTAEPFVDISDYKQIIEEAKKMKTEVDFGYLQIPPGTDIPYYTNNPTVEKIRAIPNHVQRAFSTIGYLDVENSPRYNIAIQKVYVCNTLALDLLRLILGNLFIGSRYNISTGAPAVCGPDTRKDPTLAAQFDENNLALSSDIMDWWLKEHGTVDYDWELIATQERLRQLGKDYIICGVTKDEKISRTNIGHMFVLYNPGDVFVLSQATDNIEAKGYLLNSHFRKVCPEAGEYNFYAHKIPDTYPPT